MDLGTVTFIANSFLILGVSLLLRLANTGHASCISRKSQELYLAAFTTRYLNVFRDVFEVFTAPLSYVLVIKLLLLGSTSWIIWVLRRGGVSHGADNRSCLYLLIPSVAVGVVVQYVKTQLFWGPGFALNMDLLFIVSMFIEMAAVVPQLELFRSKTIRAEDQQEGSSYDILPPIASFATYRILFVVKWLIMARLGVGLGVASEKIVTLDAKQSATAAAVCCGS
eukprot:scaffold1386_cov89-Cylindrotheca_fusiformis.AAC.3